MTIVLYEAQENGNLKFVTASETANAALAVDEFIDENPRSKLRSFVYLDTEDMESGTFGSVEVTDDAPVQPRRAMKVSGGSSSEVSEAPAPRTRRRQTAKPKAAPEPAAPSKPAAKRKTAAKKPASKPAAKKPASKPKVAPKAASKPAAKKGSPFRRNPASDE
jgi:hypothetical protein